MKGLFLSAAFFISCITIAQTSVQSSNFKKLNWLEGKWLNTNPEPGTTGYEQWSAVSANELKGEGKTMKAKDIVFQEKLKILIKDGAIYYVADVQENKEPVYFKFTELSDHGFVCENPEHDFPKQISYSLDGNKLKATISGDGKSIDFLFEKVKSKK